MSVRQARAFRKNATSAEKRIWSHLRNRQVAGLKFRRGHLGQTSDLDRELALYEQGFELCVSTTTRYLTIWTAF
jgi:hypothetical protein